MDLGIQDFELHIHVMMLELNEIVVDYEAFKKNMPNVHDLPLIPVSAQHCESNLNCVICLADYEENELVRELPCKVRIYH